MEAQVQLRASAALKREQAKDAVHLLAAARNGNLNKVRDLVEKHHYEVDMTGDEGYTALLVAVQQRRHTVAGYLVKAGADVFAKNAEGLNPYNEAKRFYDQREKFPDGSAELIFQAIHGAMLMLGECKICFEGEVSLYTLPCGDQACVECIRSWFTSLVSENDPLKCPSAECQEMDPDEVTHPEPLDAWRLMSKEEYERFDRQQLNRCLVVLRDFQFCTLCPSGGFFDKDCDEMVCAEESCGQRWCKQCRLPPHTSMSCEEFAGVYQEDHATNMTCISENCKKCPRCRAQIERDGGCSHMKCGQCKHEFCWWCLRKYRPGQYTFDETGDCPCDPNLSESGGWA